MDPKIAGYSELSVFSLNSFGGLVKSSGLMILRIWFGLLIAKGAS